MTPVIDTGRNQRFSDPTVSISENKHALQNSLNAVTAHNKMLGLELNWRKQIMVVSRKKNIPQYSIHVNFELCSMKALNHNSILKPFTIKNLTQMLTLFIICLTKEWHNNNILNPFLWTMWFHHNIILYHFSQNCAIEKKRHFRNFLQEILKIN